MHGKEVTGTATWDGTTLVINRTSNLQGMSVKVVERWTLAPDKNTLTADRQVSADAGEMAQKIVYRRKP